MGWMSFLISSHFIKSHPYLQHWGRSRTGSRMIDVDGGKSPTANRGSARPEQPMTDDGGYLSSVFTFIIRAPRSTRCYTVRSHPGEFVWASAETSEDGAFDSLWLFSGFSHQQSTNYRRTKWLCWLKPARYRT
ncbi:unnamed protein product [Pleuronectes platessa]|uniref:Uncharacterized protein n=1 Tax=Pleuronectes platessa TaxID=8262 RepID=A0A9N7VSM3_PLEPL|nr:unnamed protein product [Pleuronectes platessa]